MPLPKPRKGESRKEFIPRFIKTVAHSEPDRFSRSQRTAIAFSQWRKGGKK